MAAAVASTRTRTLDAAVELFGGRGVDAVSLDEIAVAVGVRKQTVLYWFATKDELVDAVFATVVQQLGTAIDAAVRNASDEPLAEIDSVVRAVFRAAVRTPALLGLMRELGRLPDDRSRRLHRHVEPFIDRAVAYIAKEMDAGRLRRGDPRLVATLAAATVTGIATDPEALRAVGWRPTLIDLRHLRNELRSFLRAALAPEVAPARSRTPHSRNLLSGVQLPAERQQPDTEGGPTPPSRANNRRGAATERVASQAKYVASGRTE